MTERMIGVGWFLAFAKSEQQEPAVMAELPVKKAATNLVAAMATLPAIAAKIAVLDSVCIV